MNQQSLESALRDARKCLTDWPPGTIVWHRGNGKRGVIDGAQIGADGGCLPRVTWGDGGGAFFPCELTKNKPPVDEDGEDWKNAGGGSASEAS